MVWMRGSLGSVVVTGAVALGIEAVVVDSIEAVGEGGGNGGRRK